MTLFTKFSIVKLSLGGVARVGIVDVDYRRPYDLGLPARQTRPAGTASRAVARRVVHFQGASKATVGSMASVKNAMNVSTETGRLLFKVNVN